MKRIEQTYEIAAPVATVWRALTDPAVIMKWGGGPATMCANVGEEFTLWGGDIFGRNTEVVPRKLLVQDWQDGELPEPSEVRFELSGVGGKTTLHLIHTKVPDDREADLAEGWREYYLGPLQALFEK